MDNIKFKKEIDIAVKRSKNKNYNIKQVAYILGVKYEKDSDICSNIHGFLENKKKDSKSLTYFLSLFDPNSKDFCNILIDSLYELFNPSNISQTAISKQKYKQLIKGQN